MDLITMIQMNSLFYQKANQPSETMWGENECTIIQLHVEPPQQ